MSLIAHGRDPARPRMLSIFHFIGFANDVRDAAPPDRAGG